jgi:hypothetical protein
MQMTLLSGRADGELWQPRFPSAGLRACFDRALRTVGEHNEKVEYIHLNPVGSVWSAARKIGGGPEEPQRSPSADGHLCHGNGEPGPSHPTPDGWRKRRRGPPSPPRGRRHFHDRW